MKRTKILAQLNKLQEAVAKAIADVEKLPDTVGVYVNMMESDSYSDAPLEASKFEVKVNVCPIGEADNDEAFLEVELIYTNAEG